LGFQKGVSLFLSRETKSNTGTTLLATYKRALQAPVGLVLVVFSDLAGFGLLGFYFEVLHIRMARFRSPLFLDFFLTSCAFVG
jgi:hypothetical protein